MGLIIGNIRKNSIAETMGLAPGDEVTHICGEKLHDVIDYLYFEARETLSLTVKKKNADRFEAEIEKEEDESIGIDFEGDGLGKNKRCANQCVFCFVDQLPKGMRLSLYFKDDDWRLSFIMGNYVTLTNLTEAEFARILARKVSPLYISVHATEDDVRAGLLGGKKKRAYGIMDKLARLREAGIHFNCQAVICRGINDGPVLNKTIADLSRFIPYANSLALVPVGLTRYRKGLAVLRPIDGATAAQVIDLAEAWQEKLLAEYGKRFVFCADEFYIRAKRPFPAAESYEDFSQIEDGVGMIALFKKEVRDAIVSAEGKGCYQEISIVTGRDAAPYIRWAADICQKRFGTDVHVFPVENRFFGESITVAGLLTGQDIAVQLAGKTLGECVLIPACLLRERKDTFLDDMTLQELSDRIKTRCCVVAPDGYSFVAAFSKKQGE